MFENISPPPKNAPDGAWLPAHASQYVVLRGADMSG